MSSQRLCILGSTGSIGVNTLDVAARHPGRFEVFALSAHARVDALADQCLRHRPRHALPEDRVVVGDEDADRHAAKPKRRPGTA